jgi:hypothetical protein
MVYYIPNDLSKMSLYSDDNLSVLRLWDIFDIPKYICSSVTNIMSAYDKIFAVDNPNTIAGNMLVIICSVICPVICLAFQLYKIMTLLTTLLNNPSNSSILSIMLSVLTGVMSVLYWKFIKI